jgi:hypothetical protein
MAGVYRTDAAVFHLSEPTTAKSMTTTATNFRLHYLWKFSIYFCGGVDIDANLKTKDKMYIDGDNFEKLMEKLSGMLNEIGKDLKSLINTNEVFDRDEKLPDNRDLCFLLHISKRTLQRYRTEGGLPYMKYGQKIWYKKIKNYMLFPFFFAFNLRRFASYSCSLTKAVSS